jgi:hypothetical protein
VLATRGRAAVNGIAPITTSTHDRRRNRKFLTIAPRRRDVNGARGPGRP